MSYPYDLGSYTRKIISTRVRTAKLWFERGLLWSYGYNHDEAVNCFKAAARADPQCAMAQWGHRLCGRTQLQQAVEGL